MATTNACAAYEKASLYSIVPMPIALYLCADLLLYIQVHDIIQSQISRKRYEQLLTMVDR